MIADEITTVFEPTRGVIKAKSEQVIVVTFTMFKGGKLEELFVCNVDEMDSPLGFLLKSIFEKIINILAEVFGLSVSYELYDEASLLAHGDQKTATDFLKSQSDLSSLLPPSRYDQKSLLNAAPVAARKKQKALDNENNELRLKELEFMNGVINKVLVRKFVMRNNSGIRAPFNLHSERYDPLRYLDQLAGNPLPQSPTNNDPKMTPSSKRSVAEQSEMSIFNYRKL